MKQPIRTHKLSALLLALLMTVMLTACGEEPPAPTEAPAIPTAAPTEKPTLPPTEPPVAPGEASLAALREEMEPSAAIAGIIYLGYTESEPLTEEFYAMFRDTYAGQYPFLLEIPLEAYVRNEGCEVYCIIPADPASTVTVRAWDDMEGVAGEVLFESASGDPFFIQGNVSDIMRNLSVTIVDSYENQLSGYKPGISLKDGTVQLPGEDQPLVLDLTVYPPTAE